MAILNLFECENRTLIVIIVHSHTITRQRWHFHYRLCVDYIKESVQFKRIIFPRNENSSNICFIFLSTTLRRGKGCDFIFLKHSWTAECQHIINDSWSMNHRLWCISPAEYHRFKAGNLWRQLITWITQKIIRKLKVWEKKLSGEK